MAMKTAKRGFWRARAVGVGTVSILCVVWGAVMKMERVDGFVVTPNENGFGAVVTDINVSSIIGAYNISLDHVRHEVPNAIRSLAVELKEELHKNRYLYFPKQDGLPWQHQLTFLQLFGKAYEESKHVNRKKWAGEKDPRVAVFSNDKNHGLVNVGREGFHSDGNVVTIPHTATLLFCESAIEGGDTLMVPLAEVLEELPDDLVDGVNFASAHVNGLEHPLSYPHPATGKKTMFFGLGKLSGLYSRHGKTMTQRETDEVTEAIEHAIKKVGIVSHAWSSGDLLMLDNLAMAHKASRGTQSVSDDVGVRILRRVTLGGKQRLRRREDLLDDTLFPQRCESDSGVCLVSLSHWINSEMSEDSAPGNFAGVSEARELCKYAIDQTADLAVLPTPKLGDLATELVTVTGLPHWIRGIEMANETSIAWPLTPFVENEDLWLKKRIAYPWDKESGQPNDCDGPGSEPCIFVGPHGNWFDFACERKTAEGTTPGPEITWSDGSRRMYNLYPMCIVKKEVLIARSQLPSVRKTEL